MSELLNKSLPKRLREAWSAKTASTWSAENPAQGQCSVTAIVVQHMFGGEILKTATPIGPHFYNRIDGERYDFTASQFSEPLPYQDIRSNADEALTDTSPSQVEALLEALEKGA